MRIPEIHDNPNNPAAKTESDRIHRLTLVIIAIVGGEALEAVLRRIEAFGHKSIVVFRDKDCLPSACEARYPGVDFIHCPNSPVPVRRKLGVKIAQSELVALLEDTSLPDDSWPAAILDAFFDDSVGAVGGPVTVARNLPHRIQALACCEYGRFCPQRIGLLATDGSGDGGMFIASRLPGNNLAYRRSLLLELLNNVDSLIEGEVHQKLIQRGAKLILHRGMSVTYVAVDANNAALATRFQHGRLYGGGRVALNASVLRLALFLGSFALPVILTARGVAAMPELSLPEKIKIALWIMILETAWACGEATGYLMGAGKAQESWR